MKEHRDCMQIMYFVDLNHKVITVKRSAFCFTQPVKETKKVTTYFYNQILIPGMILQTTREDGATVAVWDCFVIYLFF